MLTFASRRKQTEPDPAPAEAPEPTSVTRFEVTPGAAREVRSFVRDAVQSWHRDELIEDVALVVDELVTASLSVGSPGTVVLHDNGHGVHVEVTADTADFQQADRDSLGLRIVEATASSWGVAYTWPHYRSIWSDLDDQHAIDLRATAD